MGAVDPHSIAPDGRAGQPRVTDSDVDAGRGAGILRRVPRNQDFSDRQAISCGRCDRVECAQSTEPAHRPGGDIFTLDKVAITYPADEDRPFGGRQENLSMEIAIYFSGQNIASKEGEIRSRVRWGRGSLFRGADHVWKECRLDSGCRPEWELHGSAHPA